MTGQLIKDMSATEYHSVDALSATGLRHLARSAWHFKNRREITPTRPMLRGTLVHCARLEPAAMEQRYVVVPDDAPRRPSKTQWNAKKPSAESVAAMEWWAEFQKRCETKEIVTAEDFEMTRMQLAAILQNDTLAELFSRGYGECSVFWNDPQTGVACKARPDWVHPLNAKQVKLVDLKSTADESPNGFGRSAASFGYHRQRAHYVAGFEAATGLEVVDFVFAAVTSAPPVLAVPFVLTDEIAAQGNEEVRELIELYARCGHADFWPAYGSGPQLLDFPAWAKRNLEVEVAYVD